ncbi:MAG: tetratricopeptide (TPR) repeat protein [Aureispira sp.]|jgi:tetratricopeptide (TPR) repeat protein
MAKLTLKELENLSRLLLSPDDTSVELGLELLKNNKTAVPMLRRELILIWQLHEELTFRETIKEMLVSKYGGKQLSDWKKGFAIFTELPSIYRYNMRVQELIKTHENVRTDYQKLIERNPTYSLCYYELAYKLHRRLEKHLDVAKLYYRIVLKANPRHEDALFYLAFLLDKSEEGSKEALELYLKVENINPKASATLNNIGLIYDNNNQFDLAYAYYNKALKVKPNTTIYMRNLASLCTARMDGAAYKKQAKDLLLQLIETEPRSGANWNSWADYLWNVEQKYDAVEEAYLKGLEVAPGSASLVGNLGELYIDIRKQYDKGLELYKRSLELKNSPYRLVTMITLLVNQYKDYSTAKGYYKQLVQLSLPNQIIRNRYLRDDQWADFLAAEKVLLGELG